MMEDECRWDSDDLSLDLIMVESELRRNRIQDEGERIKQEKREKRLREPARQPVDCNVCGKRLASINVLRIHMVSHTGKRNYVCPYGHCTKRFKTRSILKRHIDVIHLLLTVSCTFCKKEFKSKSGLRYHLNSKH